jgi:hypothetical protein
MVMLLLVGGAIINVAMAWGCAAFVQIDPGPGTARGWSKPYEHLGQKTERLIRRYDAIGTTRLATGGWSNSGVKTGPIADAICPYWSDYESAFKSEPTQNSVNMHGNGWPLRTLFYRYGVIQGTVDMKIDGGFVLSDFASTGPLVGGSRFYVMRALPWRPIWPGCVINSVSYALVLWLLFVAPSSLRRRRRIKRGLCPKCAYDLRNRPTDSCVCPECGAPPPPTR